MKYCDNNERIEAVQAVENSVERTAAATRHKKNARLSRGFARRLFSLVLVLSMLLNMAAATAHETARADGLFEGTPAVEDPG